MITRIEIENFKSLKKVALSLGPLNLFIGTNASGKSNFFDALRVLQGIGNGFTIDEIFNGKPKSATSARWKSIRGGSSNAAFVPRGKRRLNEGSTGISLTVEISSKHDLKTRHAVEFWPTQQIISKESLKVSGKVVFESARPNPSRRAAGNYLQAHYFPGGNSGAQDYRIQNHLSALRQMADAIRPISLEHKEQILEHAATLSDIQQLMPSIEVLRGYSEAQSVERIGDNGENFAALIKTIIADKKNRSDYVSWLKELTPAEVDDVDVLSTKDREVRFAIKEKGVKRSARILSDGTLRFAAVAAAFFQPDMPGVITLEEIENGLHPTRLRLLVELLKSQAGERPQVFATTHSPLVLAWLNEKDYEHVFFCRRDPRSGASIIKPLSKVPRFLELARRHSVADMIAEGWLETVE